MGFYIEVDAKTVLPYLDSTDRQLAPQDRDAIDDFLEQVGLQGEKYRTDPSFRCSPGSPNMLIDFGFLASSGTIRHFRFIVTDADAAVYGVLRVTYVDEY